MLMAKKQAPLGTCDHCGGDIPRSRWYTSKRKPRLHCSRDCRNTANSRAGAPIRSEKARARVRRGEWQNPAKLNPPTPEEQARRASLGRKREVVAGTWRNPALTTAARKKLSRPRKHSGVLHSAIEKLGRGLSVSQLTPEEQEVHRQYRRDLVAARRDEVNAWYRRYYHQRQARMTDEERDAQRGRWREQWQKRKRGEAVDDSCDGYGEC